MNLFKRFSKFPKYIQSFGLKGLLLFYKIEFLRKINSSIETKYKLDSYEHPIYLRNSISDHSIFWQCIVQTQYEFNKFPQSKELHNFYKTKIQTNQKVLIIDCGANIGLSAIWLATQFPKAIIFAIEPDLHNYELLKKNTSLYGNRINCLKGAVWNKSARLKIVNPNSGSAAFIVQEDNSFIEKSSHVDDNKSIKAYTIDDICKIADCECPFIVKIDIEGSQKELFKNNTEWVKNTNLICLELEDWLMPWQGTSQPFFSCVSKYPFEYLLGGESIFCFQKTENITQ